MPWYEVRDDSALKPADALEHLQSYYIPNLKQARSEDIRELLGNIEKYCRAMISSKWTSRV